MVYVVDKYYKKISFIDGDTDRVIKTVVIPNDSPASLKYNVMDISSYIAINTPLNLLYVINSASETVNEIDGSEGNTVTNITLEGSPRALAVDDFGVYFFVVTNNFEKSGNHTQNSKVYTINGFQNTIAKLKTPQSLMTNIIVGIIVVMS
jgi:DNA-binding beta-propeller fold protein YncE